MNIMMEYWNPRGLSRLASVLGNPLHMVASTESKQNINFARLFVEMLAASKFLVIIRAKRNNGNFVDVKVEYCWKLVVCEHCKVFDHSTRMCPVATKLTRSSTPVKGTAPAAEVNAPNVWVKVGNIGKEIMSCEVENADPSVPSAVGPSMVPGTMDKQKERVEEPPRRLS
ncbi:hypothetical protein CFOL_v3_32676 [Cephalotus follicularis]|uniref:DUF4283 domain-containing protein n=1 Tax=Cephalotus follicularis TaxID=3775 RepID=A0A1Q3DAG2_CEPFO|nr:hypothetical protein CFOL_v3_32676 [Cephalotus follicularis]